MQSVSPESLKDWLADRERPAPLLLDVREPWEFAHCSIAASQSVPMSQVPGRLEEIPREQDIVVICHHGGRSQQVALFLERAGYPSVHNLLGGVDAWAARVDPAMPRY